MNELIWTTSTEYPESQILKCGSYRGLDDDVQLSLRPTHCDRGHYVVHLDVHGPVGQMLSLFGLSQSYYFREEDAKHELVEFVKLGRSLEKLGILPEFLKSFPTVEKELWVMQGKNCRIALHPIVFPAFTKVKATVANLTVDEDAKDKGLYVDEQDGWPRFYIDPEIATNETRSWLVWRKQYQHEGMIPHVKAPVNQTR